MTINFFTKHKEKINVVLLFIEKFFNYFERLAKDFFFREVGRQDHSLRILFIVIFSYSLTITFHFFYLQYFGVPYEFLNYGIKENTTFFLTFFMSVYANNQISFTIIFSIFLTIYVLFWVKKQILVILFVIILSSIFILNFSEAINSRRSQFYTFSKDCKVYEISKAYNRQPLILTHNSGKYITVYIDDKNKLLPGFSLEEPEPYPCVVFLKELGKVIK